MSEALRRARYSRQTRLAEVGEAGQTRLSSSHAVVAAGGLEGWVTARYLAGAGVGELTVRDEGIAAAARALDARVRVIAQGGAPPEGELVPAEPCPAEPCPAEPCPAEPCAFHDEAAAAVARGALAALRVVREALGGGRA